MEPAPPLKKRPMLTRDQRLQASTLRDVGWSYEKIASQLKITIRQVQYACTVAKLEPRKKLYLYIFFF